MEFYQTLTKETLDRILLGTSPHSFQFNIARMHDIYRLPKNTEPTLAPELIGEDPITRLEKFKATLLDELNEFDTADKDKLSIKQKLEQLRTLLATASTEEEMGAALELRKDCLTDIADWLADIIVYCRSEAMKFGLPLEDCQDAVMGSNFTKLASDGVPRYDANGKFLKDTTNFVPPEPAIKSLLFGVL